MSEREARGGTLVIGGGFAGGWVARYLGTVSYTHLTLPTILLV